MDELKDNTSILEKSLAEGLGRVGLEPVKISFDFVGEFEPGAFMSSPSQMNDPQQIAQLRQMAESMKGAQMGQTEAIRAAQIDNLRKMQQQTLSASPTSGGMPSPCPNCKSPNPPTNKFCNSCGAPLMASKRVCPKCGQQFEPNIKFCGNCGTKVN